MSVTLTHRGLPEKVTQYKLIALVKEVARSTDDAFSISRTAVALFEYCVLNCRDGDFAKGEICGMWEQPATIASKLNISTKTRDNAEAELRLKGYIEKTSRDHARRYGERRNNRIVSLAGISLKPAIDGYDRLVAAREAMELQKTTVRDLRREIGQLRRQIRELEQPEVSDRAEQILPRGRTSKINKLAKLQAIKTDLETLLVFIDVPSGDTKTSDRTEEKVSPNILPKDSSKNCSEVRPRKELETIPLATAARLASEDYRALLETKGSATSANLVETSAMACSWLGISQIAWGEACQQLGRERAAICVLVIDRNWRLPTGHRYHRTMPGASLKGMIRKGGDKLNLIGLLRAVQGYQGEQNEIVFPITANIPRQLPSEAKPVGHAVRDLLRNVQIIDEGES